MAPGDVAVYVDREGNSHSASVRYFHKEKETGVNIRRACVDIIYGKRIVEKSVPLYRDGMTGHYVLKPKRIREEQEAPPEITVTSDIGLEANEETRQPIDTFVDAPIDTSVDGLPDLGHAEMGAMADAPKSSPGRG